MAQPNAAELQHFFELLYPDVEDGWLVLSHPDPARLTPHGKPLLLSDWFDLSRTTWQTIARAGQRRAQQYNLYFGVALQRPARPASGALLQLIGEPPDHQIATEP